MSKINGVDWTGMLILLNLIAWIYLGVRQLVSNWISYTAFTANFAWLLNKQVHVKSTKR